MCSSSSMTSNASRRVRLIFRPVSGRTTPHRRASARGPACWRWDAMPDHPIVLWIPAGKEGLPLPASKVQGEAPQYPSLHPSTPSKRRPMPAGTRLPPNADALFIQFLRSQYCAIPAQISRGVTALHRLTCSVFRLPTRCPPGSQDRRQDPKRSAK